MVGELGRYAKEMKILTQCPTVRIAVLNREFDQSSVENGFDRRVPRVGDLATVGEDYRSRSLGYELECSNSDGTNELLVTFSLRRLNLKSSRHPMVADDRGNQGHNKKGGHYLIPCHTGSAPNPGRRK